MKKNYNKYSNSYGENNHKEYKSVKITSDNIDYKKNSSYVKEDYTTQNLDNSIISGFTEYKKTNTFCPLKGNNFFYHGVS